MSSVVTRLIFQNARIPVDGCRRRQKWEGIEARREERREKKAPWGRGALPRPSLFRDFAAEIRQLSDNEILKRLLGILALHLLCLCSVRTRSCGWHLLVALTRLAASRSQVFPQDPLRSITQMDEITFSGKCKASGKSCTTAYHLLSFHESTNDKWASRKLK